MRNNTGTWIGFLFSCSTAVVSAQQSAPPAPPASLSSSLGVVVFPSKNQTPAQQSKDEGYCFGWAKTQSGIDPMAIKPLSPDAQAAQNPADAGTGDRVKGAAGGAVAGTAVGAIAGDAGKGAAIGAVTGVVAGGAAKRRAQKEAAAQQQQAQAAAAQQAQASIDAQKATYNKTFATCMEGKGYSAR